MGVAEAGMGVAEAGIVERAVVVDVAVGGCVAVGLADTPHPPMSRTVMPMAMVTRMVRISRSPLRLV